MPQLSKMQAISFAPQGLQPDEIFIRDANSLGVVSTETTKVVILMSAFLGQARLIDNQVVDLITDTKEEANVESSSESAE